MVDQFTPTKQNVPRAEIHLVPNRSGVGHEETKYPSPTADPERSNQRMTYGETERSVISPREAGFDDLVSPNDVPAPPYVEMKDTIRDPKSGFGRAMCA